MLPLLFGGSYVVAGLQLVMGIGFNLIEIYRPVTSVTSLAEDTDTLAAIRPKNPTQESYEGKDQKDVNKKKQRGPKIIHIKADPLEKIGLVLAPILVCTSLLFYCLLPLSECDIDTVSDEWLWAAFITSLIFCLLPVFFYAQYGRQARHLISSIFFHASLCILYHGFVFLFIRGEPQVMYAEWLRFLHFHSIFMGLTLCIAGCFLLPLRSLIISTVFLVPIAIYLPTEHTRLVSSYFTSFLHKALNAYNH